MTRFIGGSAIACFMLIATADVHAQEEPGGLRDGAALARGVELFHAGEFETSVRVLTEATPSLSTESERAQAHLFIGLGQAVLGQWPDARASFAHALGADPEIEPDRQRIRPAIISAFEEVRATVLGRIEVKAPVTARVFIDGRDVGMTPLSAQCPVGRHKIIVRSQDELSELSKDGVLVRAAETTSIDAVLGPRFGRVSLRTHPIGAEVRIGDRVVARTPVLDMPLPAGSHVVMLHLNGYVEDRLELLVPPEQTVEVERVMKLPPKKTVPDPPMFGPDLREEVDIWSINLGIGFGGTVPMSASLQNVDPQQLGIDGGVDMTFELGVGFADWLEISAIAGIVTLGPDLDYFNDTVSSPGGSTEFQFHEGISGTLHMRLFRLGVEGRAVVARFGKIHPYIGFGFYDFPSAGKVIHFTPATSPGANDQYLISAELTGSAIAPMIGTRYTVLEHIDENGNFGYVAFDLVVEGRLEFMSWDAPDVIIAATNAGIARARAGGQRWVDAFATERTSVSGALEFAGLVRF